MPLATETEGQNRTLGYGESGQNQTLDNRKCPGGGGVLPIWWVIHMCRGFDPLFWPSGYETLSFWGVFFSSTNTKTIFWVQILTKFDLFGPKIPFSPRSFGVQFSVAHGTPPAIFGPSTPPGRKCHQINHFWSNFAWNWSNLPQILSYISLKKNGGIRSKFAENMVIPLATEPQPKLDRGGTPKNFWQGCAALIFDRIPLAKEILLENIPLAKEHYLIMSPFFHDFRKFQPTNSLFKRNFPTLI